MRRLLSVSILALALTGGVHAEDWFRLNMSPTVTFGEGGGDEGPPTPGENNPIEIQIDEEQVSGRIYGSMTIPVTVNGVDATHTFSVTNLSGASWVADNGAYGKGAVHWPSATEGTHRPTFEVRDAGGNILATATLEIVVHPLLEAAVSQSVYEVAVGGNLTIAPTTANAIGAIQWGSTPPEADLPEWLDFNPTSGAIAVDTTVANEFPEIVLTAVDQADRASASTLPFSISVAAACGPWTGKPAITPAKWTSVTYGNGKFVAVGENTYALTSPDGETWTGHIPKPYNTPWTSVTYGGGQFVAVSAFGPVMSSPNGTNWTERQPVADNYWTAVTYGDGLFVAVSYGYPQNWSTAKGRIMTSPDGVAWTAHNVRLGQGKYSVAYGNGKFVAVGESGPNFTSLDGVAWTSHQSPQVGWKSVTFGDGKFVAVAAPDFVTVSASGLKKAMSSIDGINWTLHETPEADLSGWFSVTYGDGQFVAVGTRGSSRIMTSPDGTNWKLQQAAELSNWQAVGYGNGKFVALSTNGTDQVMTSTCN